MSIHPTAVIHPQAQLAADVTVGPFAVIGEHVTIGQGCKIGSHVVIDGPTEIGAQCEFHPGASIGSPPQDLKYQGEPTRLIIGSHNVFREYVTVNRGTVGGGGVTTIGDHCLLMAYAHVAHDCHLGNYVIEANGVALSGHVTIEDYAIVGGLAAVHQFVRIGAYTMVGGCSGVAQDVPPYMLVSGDKARVFGLNLIGLRRRNFAPEALKALQKAEHLLYRSKITIKHAVEKIKTDVPPCAEIDYLLAFLTSSKRGVCPGARRGAHETEA